MTTVHADPIPASLPSRVEETFGVCPRFRIVVIGNSGVGKSSLVSSVFNISLDSGRVDVAEDRAGRAVIEYEHSSEENARFILHDSMGFEHGFTEKWDIVDKFLRERALRPHLMDRVHAIWLCIETPRPGLRIMQTGDEKLLSIAKELEIPVIAVFTKYDVLVVERLRRLPGGRARPENMPVAKNDAEVSFCESVRSFKSISSMEAPCVKVSTKKEYLRDTLLELTNVTRETLHDVEGELWIPWAAAQQVSARQKVELSISEGSKKYWTDLGRGTVFQDQLLVHCIARIHDDIVKVWNFNDPRRLLSGQDFMVKMFQLVDPVLQSKAEAVNILEPLTSTHSSVIAIGTPGGSGFARILGPVGVSPRTAKFVNKTYQRVPLTAQYLGAYIADLTLVLYHLFTEILTVQPPRALTREYITRALQGYQQKESAKIHERIKGICLDGLPSGFENTVAALIRELVKFN